MVEEINYCPFCGTKLESDSRYCHICGAYLSHNATDNSPSVRIIAERPLNSTTDEVPKETANQQRNKTTKLDVTINSTQGEPVEHPETEQHVRKPNNGQGLISFLFAFLSLIGVLPFFSSLIAITFGGYKAGPLGIIGRTIGWFSFIVYIGFTMMLFV